MKKRKENSTNTINETNLKNNCGIAYTILLIGGRWKINILMLLQQQKVMRYSQIKSGIEGISEKMLITRLKELEEDGLIAKKIYQQVPPKVEYSLTELGKSLQNVLYSMDDWGEINNGQSR